MEIWIWWLIATLALLTVEVLTSTVWSLCFALGCIAGLVADLCGAPLVAQFIAMAIVSILACSILLPRLKKMIKHEDPERKTATNADALIGRRATVVQTIEPGRTGRVILDGVNWQARAEHHDTAYNVGDTVTVKAVDSIILTVE